jgi:hypothetical protein
MSKRYSHELLSSLANRLLYAQKGSPWKKATHNALRVVRRELKRTPADPACKP